MKPSVNSIFGPFKTSFKRLIFILFYTLWRRLARGEIEHYWGEVQLLN
jgi:hypothetical protein